MRPGIWTRDGTENASSAAYDELFDPIAEGWISGAYSGRLYVYVGLVQSTGDGVWNSPATDHDYSNESSFYDYGNDGTNGLSVICSWVELNEYPANTFCQFLLIAQLDYTNGVITKLSQVHVGHHQDFTSETHDQSSASSYQAVCTYDGTTAANLFQDYTVRFFEGKWDNIFWSGTANPLDIDRIAMTDSITPPHYIYVKASHATYDPSLEFDTLEILGSHLEPADNVYTFYIRILYEIYNTQITANDSQTVHIPYLIRRTYGNEKHGWIRPDGQDSGIGGVDVDPRGRTVGFISATGSTHYRELQAYNFFEDVVNSGVYLDDDQVISWWPHVVGGEDIREYARIDSVNGLAQGSGRSLEIFSANPSYFQLYRFYQQINIVVNDLTQNPALDNYRFLFRDETDPNEPILKYANLSNVNVASANSAINAYFSQYAYYALSVKPFDHGDLLGLEDHDHGFYWTNCTGNIGVAGACDSTQAQNYGTSCQLTNGSLSANICGSAGRPGTFSDGTVTAYVGGGASSWAGSFIGGTGADVYLGDVGGDQCVYATGGSSYFFYSPYTVYLCDVLGIGAAGYLSDSSTYVTLCDGTVAGTFNEGAGIVTKIADGAGWGVDTTGLINSSLGYHVGGAQVLINPQSIGSVLVGSAGATYTATEQALINNLITKVNAIDLALKTHGMCIV